MAADGAAEMTRGSVYVFGAAILPFKDTTRA
jgi:hypothetical protein